MPRTKIRTRKPVLLEDTEMPRHDREKKWYEQRVAELQLEMLRVQRIYHHQGRRAVLVFEGWDAAGKGGAIRRLTGRLDPRGVRVHPISAPTADEQGIHYLYRFWTRLPKPGKIAIFDRSWYGRVLVERVEGFADKEAWSRAYDEINEFEHTLIDDGVRVVKFFLHITAEEQLKRFAERLQNPYKRWKLTEEDLRNRHKWKLYEDATNDMLARTSTSAAPWHVVGANYKWHARTEVLAKTVASLSKGVDLSLPVVDPALVEKAKEQLGIHGDLIPLAEADPKWNTRDEKKKKKKKKSGSGKKTSTGKKNKDGKSGKSRKKAGK